MHYLVAGQAVLSKVMFHITAVITDRTLERFVATVNELVPSELVLRFEHLVADFALFSSWFMHQHVRP